MSKTTRRGLLQLAAATAATSGTISTASSAGQSAAGALYSGGRIEVYTDRLSAAQGEEFSIHVSTLDAKYQLKIERLGLKPTIVWQQKDLPGSFYPTPDDAWRKGCGWPAAVKIKIPDDWKSGYYLITVTAAGGKLYYGFITVRSKKPSARILMVLATNTYHAYNDYGGGGSYTKKVGGDQGITGTTGEPVTSFLRPFFLWWISLTRDAIPAFAPAGYGAWEQTMTLWLERNGYDVDYAISSDLEFHPEILSGYRLMLSVGHDEYWSSGMRDTVESFIAKGGNVCFFSGNVAAWQVRYEDNGATMVSYKDEFRDDPVFKRGDKRLATGAWMNHEVGRPETQLTGLSWVYAGFHRFRDGVPQGPGGYLIYRPDHWIFEGTGLSYGDIFGGSNKIVHYEVDGCPIRMENGRPYPADFYDGPKSLEILGMIPASLGADAAARAADIARDVFGDANPKACAYVSANRGLAVMGIYQNNGIVFCAGTTDWTNGLAGIDATWGNGPATADPIVERVTKNILDRLSK